MGDSGIIRDIFYSTGSCQFRISCPAEPGIVRREKPIAVIRIVYRSSGIPVIYLTQFTLFEIIGEFEMSRLYVPLI